MDLDAVDREVGGPMVVRERGETVVLPPATDLPWKVAAAAVSSPRAFVAGIWPTDAALTFWKIDLVQKAWRQHNGLPEFRQLRRLVSAMEKYGDAIDADLRKHYRVSAREMWRQRRWIELLNLIDHIPQDTHMNHLLTNDEEYMEQALRNQKTPDGPSRPSMADWSMTNSLLATLIDAVNRNTAVTQGVASPKGAAPRIDPQPRPASVREKIERRIQKEKHEEMVSILLPRGGSQAD